MTKAELEQKIKDGIAKQRKILDDITLAKRDLTRQEAFDYDALERDVAAWEVELRQMEEDGGRESGPYLADWSSNKGAVRAGNMAQGVVARSGWRSVLYSGRDGRQLADGGFKSLDEAVDHFLLKPAEARSVLSYDGQAGGYMVPELWGSQVWNQVIEQSVLLGGCRLYGIPDGQAGQDFHVPCWDSSDRGASGGPVAGIAGSWIGELQASTAVSPKLREVVLSPKKFLIRIDASRESLEDGLSVAQQIGDVMRQAIIFGVDAAIFRGSGMGRPTGFMNHASRVTRARQTASSVTYLDLATMRSQLYPGCKNGVWLVSPSAYLKLLVMVDPANNYVWQPNAAAGSPQTLFGLPLYVTEHASQLGSEADVCLVALDQIAVVVRRQLIIESSNAPNWSTDQVSFRCLMRIDAQPLWKQAITPTNGGDQLGWAIVLK